MGKANWLFMLSIIVIAQLNATFAGYTELKRITWAEGNGHTYVLVQFPTSVTWDFSRQFSEDFDLEKESYLATITTDNEWLMVRDLVLEPHRRELDQAWLGATDRENEGQWKWVTGEVFSFSSPATFDNLDNEDYLVAWRFGPADPLQWNDINDSRNQSNRVLVEISNTAKVPEPSTTCVLLLAIPILTRRRVFLPKRDLEI